MSSEYNRSSLPLPIFHGENYDFWSIKMRTYFRSQNLWKIVEEGIAIPEDITSLSENQKKALEDNQQKDSHALYCLQQAMADNLFPRIMSAATAKEAWDTLQEEFQGTVKVRTVRLQKLRRDFENLKMKDNETAKDYYSRIKEIVNQMGAYGEIISDKNIVQKILISCTEKYDSIVSVIEETKDLETLSPTELMGSLEAYESRRERHKESEVENAFQSKINPRSQKPKADGKRIQEKQKENNDKYPPCGICKRKSHLEKDCWFKGKPQCQNCKKFGHTEKTCRLKKSHQANFSEEKNDENNLFYVCQAATEEGKDTWYLDSGCSNHMTKNESIFCSLDRSKTKVKIGNGDFMEAVGKGTIAIDTKKGKRYINDVLLVPNIDQNLLSVGQMIEKGYSLHFEGNSCTIYDKQDKSFQIAKVKMKENRCFPIQWKYASNVAMLAQTDESWLWHRRFGHFNFHGLKILKQKNMMRDLPTIKEINTVCEGCMLGKQHRQPFPSGKTWRAKKPLELVHTDVCGAMRTPSNDQNRYFILFIDDFTRMTWVYFMQQKSQVFDIFKKFKSRVEKQSGHYIKTIRSDRGKEYTSNEFNKFCEDEGMEHQLTVGYAPEQNGVSERKNRTVMEAARAMLLEKGLPKRFWAEAVSTAVYLLNRCPTKAVQNKTPIEAWSGRKPSAKHLKVFGCICYSHIPKEKRGKLDEKTEKGIFLGYSTQSKGYRVYSLETNKLIISRDVKFDEDAAYNWETQEVERKTVNIPLPPRQEIDQNEVLTQPTTQEPAQVIESPPDSPVRRTRPISEIYETCNLVLMEPESFEAAQKQEVWRKAMNEEIKMIVKNETWELVDRPQDKDTIGVKWVYKTKLNADGSIQKHKARLVAKGYSQQYGVDYNETFAPVARLDTIRALIALAAQKKWKIFQLDVKSAFLNGYLEEEIYVEQPQGFVAQGQEDKVLRLKKALYGLKQAPRAWYSRIDSYFTEQGFRRSKREPTLYIKTQGTNDTLIVSLYVDDLIYTSNNEKMIKKFKEDMMKNFEMTDLGLMHYFLGIEITQKEDGIFISQKKYTETLLKKFKMEGCKTVSTPLDNNKALKKEDGSPKADESKFRSLIGSLLYLTATRPDIMYAVSLLSRFMHDPSQVHYGAAKRILRYLQGTKFYGIWYRATSDSKLVGYTDSDWAGSMDDMKSTSGYAFTLGSGIFSWASKKQATVAQSSAEAEYIAAAMTTSQAIWLKRILEDMGELQEEATKIYCDSKSAIAMAKNPIFHSRTKHISIKYHFIREAEANKEIELKHCKTEEQVADIFTKALPRGKFELLRDMIGVTEMCTKEEC